MKLRQHSVTEVTLIKIAGKENKLEREGYCVLLNKNLAGRVRYRIDILRTYVNCVVHVKFS